MLVFSCFVYYIVDMLVLFINTILVFIDSASIRLAFSLFTCDLIWTYFIAYMICHMFEHKFWKLTTVSPIYRCKMNILIIHVYIASLWSAYIQYQFVNSFFLLISLPQSKTRVSMIYHSCIGKSSLNITFRTT